MVTSTDPMVNHGSPGPRRELREPELRFGLAATRFSLGRPFQYECADPRARDAQTNWQRRSRAIGARIGMERGR